MRQNLCWDYFAFVRTQLVEVVMCKSVVLKKRGRNAVPTPDEAEGYTK